VTVAMLLTCPNCGSRSVEEFAYGGEVRPPAPPQDSEPRAWFGYVYERVNRAGPQTEWWCHTSGCQLWFLAERDTTSNRVLRTGLPTDLHDA